MSSSGFSVHYFECSCDICPQNSSICIRYSSVFNLCIVFFCSSLWFVVFITIHFFFQKFLIYFITCCNLYRSLFSRKRTSIAAPEKRSLEAYFAVQPRPSGEKIAAIAEKLDLKKNVVRVWFCNQRQKQKRMKFAAQH